MMTPLHRLTRKQIWKRTADTTFEPTAMHPADRVSHRAELLAAAVSFVRAVRAISGVREISLVGSMVTSRANPKDIDFLVRITDEMDVAVLARYGRQLQGRAQQCNRGADIFLADERGQYLGRTCHWKDCRPGVRRAALWSTATSARRAGRCRAPSRLGGGAARHTVACVDSTHRAAGRRRSDDRGLTTRCLTGLIDWS